MSTSTTAQTPRAGGLISTAELRSRLDQNPDHLVVDVRTPREYGSGHIAGSINLPLDQVDAHLGRIVSDAGGSLVLVCQAGGRAGQAYDALTGAGLDDLVVLDGGMNAWLAAGAPAEVSSTASQWTIERQVRLAAGLLVFSSVAASAAWRPAVLLAGGVGAGLTFAAVSNTCAMGAALMRLPFNRAPVADVESALARIRG